MTGRSYIFTQTTILTCLKGGHKETLRSPMLFCGYKVGHHLVNLQSLRAKYEQLMRYTIFHFPSHAPPHDEPPVVVLLLVDR